MTKTGQRLPRPLMLPLSLLPDSLHSRLMALALNRVFAPQVASGEMDFLNGRAVCIRVKDARFSWRLMLHHGRFIPCNRVISPDVTISGDAYDFLLLATRREDSDTLFFQRRLSIEGDTELGLQLKNVLDGVDMDELAVPAPLRRLMHQASGLVDRLPV